MLSLLGSNRQPNNSFNFPTHLKPGAIAPDVIFDFGVLAGPVTVLPALISIVFYLRYDIDEKRHDAIRLELSARKDGGAG